MITTSDFSKGTRYLHNGIPYTILDVTTQSPTARGSSTLVKVKSRDLLSGKLVSETFKAGTKFEQPDLRIESVQYLYIDGESACFMDQATYDQFELPISAIENELKYLNEELKIKAMYFNDNPISIEIPAHVKLTVTSVEPGTRGNTATSSVTTKAELSNGMECQVPLNIKENDEILIDTATGSFYSRA